MVNIKKLSCILLALAAMLTLFGCSQGSSQQDGFTLKLGFDAEFPPYGYLDDNGEYVGFDIDMAKELCSRLGWELQLVPINWDTKDFELESGTIDCIWNGFTMNGREDKYTWSKAYMDNSQVFIVRSESGITDKAALAGKTVAVQQESSALSALEEDENADLLNSFKQLVQLQDYNTAFMELESGAVDAIAMDIGVAKYQIQGREDEYTILDEAIQSEQYAVGFYIGNTELRDKVQAELMKMAEDGTFATISENWFGYDVCILGE